MVKEKISKRYRNDELIKAKQHFTRRQAGHVEAKKGSRNRRVETGAKEGSENNAVTFFFPFERI